MKYDVETEIHPIFNLPMPRSCPGVPSEVLNPRNTWDDASAYDTAANKLRDMFKANYEAKEYAKLGIADVM